MSVPAPSTGSEMAASVPILIVEDSATQRELLHHTLQQNGFEVSAASGAHEALALLERIQPAMVITDILMPDINGFELCRRIKAQERLSHTPVILLTALSDTRDVIRGLECGADNFIIKPYEEQNLLRLVHYMLSNRALSERERDGTEIEIVFSGEHHRIRSRRRQILDLLLSTYAAAVRKNEELEQAREQLKAVNTELEQRVNERTASLEQANQSLESFCYTIAHDLRSPLRAIQGYTSILLEKYGRFYDAEARTDAGRVMDAARKMDQLIRDLLAYGRVSQAEIPLSDVSLEAELDTVLEPLRKQLEQQRAQLRIRRPLPRVRANALVLGQALGNLLHNALKFTKEDATPVIEIWAENAAPGRVRLQIRDNGIGIDPAYQGRIFGLFERLHDTRKYPGTGVGLVIVKKGIERMGGCVGVESKPGEGARFWIDLPAQPG